MTAEVLQPQVVQATALTDEHCNALAVLLRMAAVIYIPCDIAPPLAFLMEMESKLPGTRWTYYGPQMLSGPTRFYGHPRIRVELQQGLHPRQGVL